MSSPGPNLYDDIQNKLIEIVPVRARDTRVEAIMCENSAIEKDTENICDAWAN